MTDSSNTGQVNTQLFEEWNVEIDENAHTLPVKAVDYEKKRKNALRNNKGKIKKEDYNHFITNSE